jgi:hypothetical protein
MTSDDTKLRELVVLIEKQLAKRREFRVLGSVQQADLVVTIIARDTTPKWQFLRFRHHFHATILTRSQIDFRLPMCTFYDIGTDGKPVSGGSVYCYKTYTWQGAARLAITLRLDSSESGRLCFWALTAERSELSPRVRSVCFRLRARNRPDLANLRKSGPPATLWRVWRGIMQT